MTDEGVLLEKPAYSLKPEEMLASIEPAKFIVERKIDGSLGNVVIKKNRAIFRSHRETGQPYFDRLPQLETLHNQSRLMTSRLLMPSPDLEGTVLQGELVHPDGASRVSGILNALPQNAQAIQKSRGPVEFYGWDVVKYKGRDVSRLPYAQRRALLEESVSEIRCFNKHWHVVDRMPEGMSPEAYYQKVINDPRGLPWSEGVVVKSITAPAGDVWLKVKRRDFEDFIVQEILPSPPGTRYANSMGVMVVEDPVTGNLGEVGSFAITDAERQWIFDHRTELVGAVAKVSVMEKTQAGAPRAGVFHSWHGDPRMGGMGTEIREAAPTRKGKLPVRNWLCQCDCGANRIVSTSHFNTGKARNCGNHEREMPNRKGFGEAARNTVIAKYRKRAEQLYKLPFTLSDEEAARLLTGNCFYCGAEPATVKQRKGDLFGRFVYSGIDRLDSRLGYMPGNVVSCCTPCNRAKMDRSPEEFISWAMRLVAHQQDLQAKAA
jgi:hypothetical protein